MTPSPPTPRAGPRVTPYRLAVATAAAILLVALAILGWRVMKKGEVVAPRGTDVHRRSERAADASVDKGPWPMQGHDLGRTSQSHLAGPSRAEVVTLLYASPTPLSWDDGNAGKDRSVLVATSGSTLITGTCGTLRAMNLAGQSVWQKPLAVKPVHEGIAGITAGVDGILLVATHECPAVANPRTHLYGLAAGDGSELWSHVVGQMFAGPSLSADGRWYTISDSNLLRVLGRLSPEPIKMTDLAGDRHGAIALDSRGNLYVGTNGGDYNRESLWSLTPEGDVRWATAAGNLSTPAVSADDRVLVAGSGHLVCYDSDGTLRWTRDVGSMNDSHSPVAVARSGNVYVLSARGLLAFDADGRERWRKDAGDGPTICPGPILDNDENVYVAFADGVRSYTSTGTERWSVPLAEAGNMIIGGDGVVCVVSQRRRIYSIAARPPGRQDEAASLWPGRQVDTRSRRAFRPPASDGK